MACSLGCIGWRPGMHRVATWSAYGYTLERMDATLGTYGCSLGCLRLQPAILTVAGERVVGAGRLRTVSAARLAACGAIGGRQTRCVAAALSPSPARALHGTQTARHAHSVACALHGYCTACALRACRVHTACTLCAHRMHTACTPHVHRMCTACAHRTQSGAPLAGRVISRDAFCLVMLARTDNLDVEDLKRCQVTGK